MAFTTADLAALERAIASGELSWRYGDRTVTYQSMNDMLSARRQIIAEIDLAAGKKPRRRTYRVFQSGRGNS